ncbi:MGDG synthase family glycosyltransferase [Ructibacterium gallinarum]|uniref:Glycosyltransferase n=1 Tax=Ructibacterium gallinarum TaxID=2779355 RepID=A0A9D5R8A7_9FIRM|nr:glycosyltransferase [Ructibacterium gallinarum]MBE5039762.1 glycosyltransferase [Ructibacterium gallinarum]
MKALVFSITAGQGHNQTAKVVSDYLNETGVECKYMDVFEYINPLLSESVSKIYLMSTKNIPKIYGGGYRMCEKRDSNMPHVLPKLTNTLLARRLLKLVRREKPDVIICTHVFAALLVTYLAGHIDVNTYTIGIVTDFTIHPYWEDTCLDYYITASELLTYQGKKKGIPEEKFKPFGIPIDPKFAISRSKTEACRMLGIPEKNTVLVMSGSMGYGNIMDEILALDRLDLDFQIAMICGNNKKLKSQIDKLKLRKNIYNYGYVNNVDVFMDAADCMVTKPGGLTTSEALAKGVPMIMSNPVPGQEDRNVEFLLNTGAAIKISKTFPIDDALYYLFVSDERRMVLERSIQSLRKPDSTKVLAEFITALLEKGEKRKKRVLSLEHYEQ